SSPSALRRRRGIGASGSGLAVATVMVSAATLASMAASLDSGVCERTTGGASVSPPALPARPFDASWAPSASFSCGLPASTQPCEFLVAVVRLNRFSPAVFVGIGQELQEHSPAAVSATLNQVVRQRISFRVQDQHLLHVLRVFLDRQQRFEGNPPPGVDRRAE